jgi:HAMP domain-containing protein
VANQRGEILVHPDAKLLLEHPKTEQDSLFQEALATKTRLSVARREDGSRHVLAAFGKGFAGQLIVVAKADESEVFKVVGDLAVRTLLFGALVLTLVILAAFLISRSLTENIAVLTERMETAAKGDLSTRIQIRGADETIILANTFNQMIGDLKESRDALEMMNRELDQKVKERTLELEEQHRKVKEVQEALVQTYASSTYGIRFTYPDTYVLSERDEGNAAERTHHVIVLTDRSALSLTPENGEGPPTITIAVFGNAHERLTPESWIKNVSASNFKLSPDNTLATTTIASSTAYTYTWDGLYRGESAVLTHGSDIIMLSVTSLDSADRIRDDFIDMLSTFTLQ